jgi:hypothetical protein
MNNQIEKMRLMKGIKDQNTHHHFFPCPSIYEQTKTWLKKVPSKKKNKMI